ncbi:MAG TPA: ParB/RepB/Spo0J family partition protein [Acetobacteraceae bacterium]|nr:ParB/RepB/Spo0J family partition protein [Acetobacteraceae bacterium]
MNARRDPGPRLGRGLAALLGDAAVPVPAGGATVRKVPLDLLEPNPFQPRSSIDPAALEELTQSIRLRGILQPLLVRPHPAAAGRYQIVAGERRWRAAGAAGLHEVPALVNEMTDIEAAAVALVENLQRQDLNPMDEAEGYDRLLTRFEFTQEALGQAVGKSRSHIANTLRLLGLPPAVKAALRKGEITAGHARALLASPAPETALRDVIDRQLSVRQTEALATRKPSAERTLADDLLRGHGPDAMALERYLSEQLGLTVKVTFNGRRGVIQFHYTDVDQLDNLLSRLGLRQ